MAENLKQIGSERRLDRRLLIALVAGLALICLCLCAVVAASGGLLFFADDAGADYPVEVAVAAPARARVGERFTIEIAIDNPTLEAHQLDSIDIDLSYLEGVEIMGSSPPYHETFLLTPLLPQRTFSFDTTIPAGETMVIELQAMPRPAGSYSGNIDVCIKSGGNCRATLLRAEIE